MGPNNTTTLPQTLVDKVLNCFFDFFEKTKVNSIHSSFDIVHQPGKLSFLDNTIYIDSSITNYIHEHNKYHKVYKYTISSLYNPIHFEYHSFDTSSSHADIERFLKYTMLIISILSSIKPFQKECSIYILDVPINKTLPSTKDEPLSPKHVNSGVTISSSTFCDVIVFRREEMTKVLIHELIHAFGIDSHGGFDKMEIPLKRHFCQHDGHNLNINECFTDALAVCINTIVYTCFSKPKSFYKSLSQNWQIELLFMKQQASKVLLHNDFNGKVCNKMNNEATHAISYYVIKYILLQNMPIFTKYLNKYNFTLGSETEFFDMVYQLVKSFDYTQLTSFNNHLSNNLRMTSLDVALILKNEKAYKAKPTSSSIK